MNANQQQLWNKLEALALDESGARLTFTQRLARENGWSADHARHVVQEYKRFLFLAASAGHPVTPSEDVDQAWHLHLVYTESYWSTLCRDILGFQLHHGPTRGGAREGIKFRDWYGATLQSYEKFFGHRPPSEVWPPVEERFADVARFRRINTRKNWVIPKHRFREWLGRWNSVVFMPLVFVGIILLTGCTSLAVSSLNVFDWKGPEFLCFYVILLTLTFSLAFYVKRLLLSDHTGGIPTGLTDPYDMVVLAQGSVGAADTAILALAANGALTLEGGTTPMVKVKNATFEPAHPFEAGLFRWIKEYGGHVETAVVRTKGIEWAEAIEGRLTSQHLLATDAQADRVKFQCLGVVALALAVGGLKIVIGMSRGKPVGFLFFLCIVALVAGLVLFLRRPRRTTNGDLMLAFLKQKYDRLQSSDWGNSSVTNADMALACGLFGMSILANTGYANLRRQLNPAGSASDGGYITGCSSTSDSSDSGGGAGSGDSGGGGCGGGGCGGCGGGGD